MHYSRMRIARSLPYGEGVCPGVVSLDRTPPLPEEHRIRDRDPPEGTWDQAVRQEVTSYRDQPTPP